MRFISYAVIFHADANASDSECETLSYKKSQIGFVKAPTIIAIGVFECELPEDRPFRHLYD
jgi:hypothetical protein